MTVRPLEPGKPTIITSHSPKAPFSAVFEDDGKEAHFYAARDAAKGDPTVDAAIKVYSVDQLESAKPLTNIDIVWAEDGESVALVLNQHFHTIFDFPNKTIHASSPDNQPDTAWKQLRLEWTDPLLKAFETVLFDHNNRALRTVVLNAAADNTENARLALFKQLMTHKIVAPINAPQETEGHHFMVFPYQKGESILCTFTDYASFNENLGTEIHRKSIFVPELFALVQKYNIAAVLVTAPDHKSVIITKEEFPILSITQDAQQQSYREVLKRAGKLLIKPPSISGDEPWLPQLKSELDTHPILDAAYLFESTATNAGLILGLCLNKVDERDVIKIYRNVAKVMGSFLTDNTPLEITVLKPADSLTRVVKDQMEPFYLREKTLET